MEGFKGRTPPWHYDEALSGVYSSSCRFVCDVTDKHNGTLIAAAPELLEALRQLYDMEIDLHPEENSDWQDDRHPMTLARKAISKALGGE